MYLVNPHFYWIWFSTSLDLFILHLFWHRYSHPCRYCRKPLNLAAGNWSRQMALRPDPSLLFILYGHWVTVPSWYPSPVLWLLSILTANTELWDVCFSPSNVPFESYARLLEKWFNILSRPERESTQTSVITWRGQAHGSHGHPVITIHLKC